MKPINTELMNFAGLKKMNVQLKPQLWCQKHPNYFPIKRSALQQNEVNWNLGGRSCLNPAPPSSDLMPYKFPSLPNLRFLWQRFHSHHLHLNCSVFLRIGDGSDLLAPRRSHQKFQPKFSEFPSFEPERSALCVVKSWRTTPTTLHRDPVYTRVFTLRMTGI